MDAPPFTSLLDRKVSPPLNKSNSLILAQEYDVGNGTRRLVAFSLRPFRRLAEVAFSHRRILSISASNDENEAIVAYVKDSEVHLARVKYSDDYNVKLTIDAFDVIETEQSNIAHAGWCQGATIWSSREPEALCLIEKGQKEGTGASFHLWNNFCTFNIDNRYSSIIAVDTNGVLLILNLDDGQLARTISYRLMWNNGSLISRKEQVAGAKM